MQLHMEYSKQYIIVSIIDTCNCYRIAWVIHIYIHIYTYIFIYTYMWYMCHQQLADWDAKLRPDSLMLSSALNACRDGAEFGGNCAEQARFWSARWSNSDIYIYVYVCIYTYIYVYIYIYLYSDAMTLWGNFNTYIVVYIYIYIYVYRRFTTGR